MVRRYIAPAIAGLGFIAGLIGVNRSIQPSYNLSMHLRDPVGICLQMPDYTAREFIRQYKKEIVEASRKYDVPPELVAPVFLSENFDRRRFEDWKDWLATGKTAKFWDTSIVSWAQQLSRYFRPTNPSLGPGQIQVRTAQSLDRKFNEPVKTREELEVLLQQPIANIEYVAKSIAELLHRSNRLGNSHAYFDPHLVSIIGTEYVKGSTQTPLEKAQPRMEGLSYAVLLSETDIQKLLKINDGIKETQRQAIRKYVEGKIAKDEKSRAKIERIIKTRKGAENYYSKLPC